MKPERTFMKVAASILIVIACMVLVVLIATTYPLNPKIIDIDLPLRIQDKQAITDDFITYETTFTQYRTLDATVITYLIPKGSEEHIELTRTKARIHESHNLHVRNNVFIPPGTAPGEYEIHIHVEYEWNRFRTVDVHLESDSFFILDPDGSINTPTETGTFREKEEPSPCVSCVT